MLEFIRNQTIFANKYKSHPQAAIVACYFNPQMNAYRSKAFQMFYSKIEHLNHLIVECTIGDSKPELPINENIIQINTNKLLWHKESLLNLAIGKLPQKYKYIFWLDTDILFNNLNWMVEGVNQLKKCNILQPFEHCVHLDRDELKPSQNPPYRPNNHNVWRSFCANHTDMPMLANSHDYNTHGHVGFAWGARREILDRVPLYDRALIGGADHIIAHAAAGQIPHPCITKAFSDNIAEIETWSHQFYRVTQGKISYVKGDLYHLWHGEIKRRNYLKRIQDFTAQNRQITERDDNGLYITDDSDTSEYIEQYFQYREATEEISDNPDLTCTSSNDNNPQLECVDNSDRYELPTNDSNQSYENFS